MDLELYILTDQQKQDIMTALVDANTVLANVNATQVQVDNILNVLTTTTSGMTYKDADYTKVDEALADVPTDLSMYTTESTNALNIAISAVIAGKTVDEQSIVDGYATAIETALSNLQYKDADYTKINELLGTIENTDLDRYMNVDQLKIAISEIDFGKNITEQTIVDAKLAQLNDLFNQITMKPVSNDVTGAGTTITSSDGYVPFTIENGSPDEFVNVYLDGKEIEKTLYRIKQGSLVVELAPELITTLAQGEHTLEIATVDTVYSTTFVVNTDAGQTTTPPVTTPDSPATGGMGDPLFYIALATLALIASKKVYLKTK